MMEEENLSKNVKNFHFSNFSIHFPISYGVNDKQTRINLMLSISYQQYPDTFYTMNILYTISFFFYIYSLVNLVVFVRVLGTCYGKETSRFCQAQNFEASFFCTAHFITSACSFNIGLALLLGIRSLDPRPRARTAPALA